MAYAYPLDSVVEFDEQGLPTFDRAVSSETLRKIWSVMLTDGVFLEDSSRLMVTATTNMNVKVNNGYLVIRGAQKWVEDDITLDLGASSSQPRIDTVIARLDLNQNVRDIIITVKQGTPATNPVAPQLERTSSIWELALADILIPASSTSILQKNITDTRLDTSRCGIVSSLMKFDTTKLYNQIEHDLSRFQYMNENEFNQWFDEMKNQLSEDAAGNLQLEIDELATTIQQENLLFDADFANSLVPITSDIASYYKAQGWRIPANLPRGGNTGLVIPSSRFSGLEISTPYFADYMNLNQMLPFTVTVEYSLSLRSEANVTSVTFADITSKKAMATFYGVTLNATGMLVSGGGIYILFTITGTPTESFSLNIARVKIEHGTRFTGMQPSLKDQMILRAIDNHIAAKTPIVVTDYQNLTFTNGKATFTKDLSQYIERGTFANVIVNGIGNEDSFVASVTSADPSNYAITIRSVNSLTMSGNRNVQIMYIVAK